MKTKPLHRFMFKGKLLLLQQTLYSDGVTPALQVVDEDLLIYYKLTKKLVVSPFTGYVLKTWNENLEIYQFLRPMFEIHDHCMVKPKHQVDVGILKGGMCSELIFKDTIEFLYKNEDHCFPIKDFMKMHGNSSGYKIRKLTEAHIIKIENREMNLINPQWYDNVLNKT
jgi:hypothetical protein